MQRNKVKYVLGDAYVSKKTRQKNGRTQLSFVDGNYEKDKGHSRTITVEKIGYLDELEKQHSGPIAFFDKLLL